MEQQHLTVLEQKEEIEKLNLKTLRRLNPQLNSDPEFLAATRRQEYLCPVCGGPMLASPGQIVNCHKGCRHRLKEMRRRIIKNHHLE